MEWQDLRALELEGTGWAVIVGHKRDSVSRHASGHASAPGHDVTWSRSATHTSQDPLRAVLPLPLHTTTLRPSSLRQIFSAISTLSPSSLPPVIPAPAPSLQDLRKRLDGDNPALTDALTNAGAGADADEDGPTDIVSEAVVATDIVSEAVVPATPHAEGANAFDTDTLYLAISTTDSSVVYYKLSKGIKKPADIPDE